MLHNDGSTVQSISCRWWAVKGSAHQQEAELVPEPRTYWSIYDQMQEGGTKGWHRIWDDPVQGIAGGVQGGRSIVTLTNPLL
jgi:hypothetical protein